MSAVATRVVIPALGVAITGHLLRALIARWSKSRYGGLESLVSFSSRLIAAARAAESLRADAFVIDPLAYILAGPKAMAKYKADDQKKTASSNGGSSLQPPSNTQVQHMLDTQQDSQRRGVSHQSRKGSSTDLSCVTESDSTVGTGTATDTRTAAVIGTPAQEQVQNAYAEMQQQQRPVPRLIMRTVFFDDVVLAAVGKPAQRSHTALQAFLQQKHQRGLHHCTQVVLLGSGMDTRPWRLELPPGVAWFEIDRQDVLRAKQSELQKSGVEFTPCKTTSSDCCTRNGQHSWGHIASYCRLGKQGKAADAKRVCWLKAKAWNCAAVDLQVAGWSEQLIHAGLDTQQPTLWVAEGLLYYLDSDCVKAMLQEIAQISAPGSVFASNFMTESGLKGIREGLSSKSTAATADESQEASEQSTGTRQSSAQKEADNAAVSTGSQRGASSLLSQFIWGCPDDVDQYFYEHGWEMLVCLPWTDAAEAYGWTPQQAASAAGRSKSQQLQLTIAVLKADTP